MLRKKYIKYAEGKTINNLIAGWIFTWKSSIIPNINTGKEQNNKVWIKSYSETSENIEIISKEANIPIPPNLEIDFLWRVWGPFLKLENPNLTLTLSRKIKRTPIRKDIGNISVIKIIHNFF